MEEEVPKKQIDISEDLRKKSDELTREFEEVTQGPAVLAVTDFLIRFSLENELILKEQKILEFQGRPESTNLQADAKIIKEELSKIQRTIDDRSSTPDQSMEGYQDDIDSLVRHAHDFENIYFKGRGYQDPGLTYDTMSQIYAQMYDSLTQNPAVKDAVLEANL